MSSQRHELGAFLRSRRERITPAEAGLPQTGRRRTPGLRREELALLAGISATWYTYLEQGRDVRASDQVLTALAGALRLDRHERDHLFHLAGHMPAAETEEQLTAEVAAIPMLLQSNPAYIISASYDVLSHNQATDDLFPNFPRPANFVRWVFTEPVARYVLVDWEPEARGLLARLRTLADRYPGHAGFTRLLEDLHEASPEVRAWWPHYEVQARGGGRKRLRRADGAVIDFAYTAFHLAEQPDHTLVIYSDGRTSRPSSSSAT
ncbi:transcriptional regulator with XRE-family HTH domain [Kibdelosporangium banguiense]|uniref:Transcriptional regulator with XRE-family HTH domain n=1 Tax=Kibdelosporangium banguiense TaxID=1365924 RepID=A0ABS4TB83_9PSEU|nr:helix-turn-helix transcriptional regulator [Kibdelosporangium banguiense]MBP2321675.1 transcriptional regulator with XRE-family HTH domain [Kibdelosporangium banguiense]